MRRRRSLGPAGAAAAASGVVEGVESAKFGKAVETRIRVSAVGIVRVGAVTVVRRKSFGRSQAARAETRTLRRDAIMRLYTDWRTPSLPMVSIWVGAAGVLMLRCST